MITHAEKEKVNCEDVVTSSATTTKSTGSATGSTRLHSQPSANDTALGFKGKLLLSPPPGQGEKEFLQPRYAINTARANARHQDKRKAGSVTAFDSQFLR